MPSLGADMTEGTLIEWRVKPGDTVHRGDIVAVVDTSKAEIEVEVFEDGTVESILVPEGELVPVGTVLATISGGNGAMPAAASTPPVEPAPEPESASAAKSAPASAPAIESAKPPAPIAAAPHPHRRRISPLARRIAESHGIDPATVHGTGPGGAITKIDVERTLEGVEHHEPAPPPTAPAVASPQDDARRAAAYEATAALMARSKREVPHYYLGMDMDMTQAMRWLDETNESRRVGERLLPAALLVKATALAAQQVPEINGFWVDGRFQAAAEVHVGIAISMRGGGVVAPAIRDTANLTLDEVMAGLRDVVKRTRAGRLRSGEMSSPTITVTNLGDRGVDFVHGVIYVPQVALVGFGRVREVPWAVDGMLDVRPVVTATLAADHRASEGHRGSLFLAALDHFLQEPETL